MPVIPQAAAGQNVMAYIAPSEQVTMSRHQLILEFDRARRRARPHGEWPLIPLAMFLGLLPCIVTKVTFNDAFGIAPAVWQAVVLILTLLTLATTVVLTIAWVVMRLARPEKTSEEVIDQLLQQMDRDNERVAQRSAGSPRQVAEAVRTDTPTPAPDP